MRHFDAIFIGAGQAAPFLAARMAAEGRKVALVERKHLGGTCVNSGCMPTKTLVASARAIAVTRSAGEYGAIFGGPIDVDLKVVKGRAQTVINNGQAGLKRWFDSLETMEVIFGHARFNSPCTIVVGSELLTAPQIFINVGARPRIPDINGIGQVPYLTSTSIINLEHVPAHLVIVGGSYIALEFAQMYRRFGSEVTILERGRRLARREDEDISICIEDILRSDGITIHTNVGEILLHTEGETKIVSSTSGRTIAFTDLLIAVGRKPNTDDLALELAGVNTDEHGFIRVDDKLSTNVPGIWALGDCNGRGAFTHTAYNDFEIVAANLLDGEDRKLSDRILGYALYIDPPLGRAGLTEREARELGREIVVSKRLMSSVGRALERGETRGLMKLVADAKTKQIIGAAILGVEGDEAIHGILNAINMRTPYDALKWAVPIHPTVSELIPTLIGGLRPTH